MSIVLLGQLGEAPASFTGSPITVYSKRSSAPTLPASTVPEDTPMPALRPPTSSPSRTASARAAARARSAGSPSAIGAPKIASAASPSNLLIHPSCSSTTSTTTPKKRLSISTTSWGGRSEANEVDPTTSLKSTAT